MKYQPDATTEFVIVEANLPVPVGLRWLPFFQELVLLFASSKSKHYRVQENLFLPRIFAAHRYSYQCRNLAFATFDHYQLQIGQHSLILAFKNFVGDSCRRTEWFDNLLKGFVGGLEEVATLIDLREHLIPPS